MRKSNKVAPVTAPPVIVAPVVELSPAQKAWVTRRAANANIGTEQANKAWATRRANKAAFAAILAANVTPVAE